MQVWSFQLAENGAHGSDAPYLCRFQFVLIREIRVKALLRYLVSLVVVFGIRVSSFRNGEV